MKKLILLFMLLLLISSAYAYDISACSDNPDGNFSKVGDCIIRGAFGGDYLFFAILLLLIFSLMMWQTGMPVGPTLGVGLIMFFAMSSFFGIHYQVLLNLSILAIGTMVGLAILHFVRR